MSEGSGELPQGWEIASIDELCELNPKHDKGLSDDLEVSFVPMAAVSDITGTIFDAALKPYGEVRKGYTHFANGDVIFAKITPCMENGKAASVRGLSNGLGCGTTEFYVFRQRGALDQDYLFYFVRQESYRKRARAQMQSGVGQARVPKEFVLGTELPVPPLPEQRRIVAKIEALQERSARAREALSEVGPLLEQFRQSVLQAAFSGRLTADWRAKHSLATSGERAGVRGQNEIETAQELLARIRTQRRKRWEQDQLAKYQAKGKQPPNNWQDKYQEPEPVDTSELPQLPDGWCWVMAKEIVDENADIRYGIVQPGPPLKNGVPYVRGVDIQDNEILVDQLWNTSHEIAHQYRNSALAEGDVLLAIIRHLKVAIVPRSLDGANMARTTARLRPSEAITTEYLAQALRSPICQNWLKSNYRGGTSMPKVNIADAVRLPIPLAPMKEQLAVTQAIKAALTSLNSVLSAVALIETEQAQLDQSILAKAFRGELVPQDPTDEPASALLTRIRTTRETAIAKKSSKRKDASDGRQ